MSGEELNGVQKSWGVVCEGSGEQTTGHFQEKEGPSQKGLARPLGAKSSVKGTCKDIIEVLEAFLDVFISIFFYLPFFFFFLNAYVPLPQQCCPWELVSPPRGEIKDILPQFIPQSRNA